MFASILKLFDSYSRVARLYPALLTVAPILWTAVVLVPSLLENMRRSAGLVAGLAVVTYFLASVARSRGKIVEERLLAEWGGWPTTTMLRHRDTTLDPITTKRYHKALKKLCPGSVIPSDTDERDAPAAADDVYRSLTKQLLELRRAPTYKHVHSENASYGFRRNMLGLKPIALVIAAVAACLTGAGWFFAIEGDLTWLSVKASAVNYPHLPVLLALDILWFFLWLVVITPQFVKQAAYEYAHSLFRTLDAPASAPKA